MTFDPATASYIAIERQARAMQGRELARLTRKAAIGLGRLVGGLGLRFAQMRAIDELHRLDDHMLADIGLSRHEIEARVMAAVDRPARDTVSATVIDAPVAPLAANDSTYRSARVA